MSTKRSTRKRTANKKYSNDAFEGLDLFSSPEPQNPITLASDPEDDDFAANDAAAAAVVEEDDQVEEGNAVEVASEGADSIATPDEDNVSDILDEDDHEPGQSTNPKDRPKRRKTITKSNGQGEEHSRGTRYYYKHSDKDLGMLQAHGTESSDVAKYVASRNRWISELTLPSREANFKGEGGMAHSTYQSKADRLESMTLGWQWYGEQGKAWFSFHQKVLALDKDSAAEYMAPQENNLPFVLGPHDDQQLFSLQTGQFLNLNHTWQSIAPGSDSRHAWLLHLGDPIHCLDWTRTQSGRHILAVSTLTTRTVSVLEKQFGHGASAFTPSPPEPSCIQFWEFAAESRGSGAATLSNDIAPTLRKVICTDFGYVRAFKWSPSPITHGPTTTNTQEDDDAGLLATLHSDGSIRVINVHLRHESTTEFTLLTMAAFTSRPPSTVCTCLTWITSSILAAGCANGAITLWDVSSLSSAPIFHHALHSSYVLALTHTGPSQPHLLISSSISGHTTLTDVRTPIADTSGSRRTRVPSPLLAWHEASQHALSLDDGGLLRMLHVRALQHPTQHSRSSSMGTCVAASGVHAAVLVGTADGSVAVINPMTRIMANRGRGHRWRQKWIGHEWSAAAGRARLTTGWRAEDLMKLKTLRREPDELTVREDGDHGILTTLHEEKTRVACAAWNPSVDAGGWAAVGFGTGLLWVEDVCWD